MAMAADISDTDTWDMSLHFGSHGCGGMVSPSGGDQSSPTL